MSKKEKETKEETQQTADTATEKVAQDYGGIRQLQKAYRQGKNGAFPRDYGKKPNGVFTRYGQSRQSACGGV